MHKSSPEVPSGGEQGEQPLVSSPSREGNGYTAPIIYKAFAIMQAVANNSGSLGISDLSRMLNINKSTVFGIMQALLDLGALLQDETTKKFSLGPSLHQLGSQSMAGISFRALAWPYMEKIAHEFGQTVFLGRFHDYGVTMIGMADGQSQLKISAPAGARIPFFAGALAKTYLACLDDRNIQLIFKERDIPKFTANSITDAGVFISEIEKTRQQGYATDFGEYLEGINTVSIPLTDASGTLVAAFWIVGLNAYFGEEQMHRCAAMAKQEAILLMERWHALR